MHQSNLRLVLAGLAVYAVWGTPQATLVYLVLGLFFAVWFWWASAGMPIRRKARYPPLRCVCVCVCVCGGACACVVWCVRVRVRAFVRLHKRPSSDAHATFSFKSPRGASPAKEASTPRSPSMPPRSVSLSLPFPPSRTAHVLIVSSCVVVCR
jgi:hypothetical protein